jgi:hypothetical protein
VVGTATEFVYGSIDKMKEMLSGDDPKYKWQEVYNALPSNMYLGTKYKDPLNPTNVTLGIGR